MKSCCAKEQDIVAIRESHGRVLWIVLAINTIMFLVELVIGLTSQSTSVLADSLDMLGDALVYSFSLFVLGKGLRWEARASMLKGSIMFVFGLGVFVEAIYKLAHPVVPEAAFIGIAGVAALLMNSLCFFLLWKHRHDNINMQSTWICSRNDLIGNAGVIAAGVLTSITASKWPDLIIGIMIATIFMQSAIKILSDARSAKKTVCLSLHNEAGEEKTLAVTIGPSDSNCANRRS